MGRTGWGGGGGGGGGGVDEALEIFHIQKEVLRLIGIIISVGL